MGIYTAESFDSWVPDQFQGFDGFPPDQGGVLAIATPPNTAPLYNTQPLATTASVMGITVPNDGGLSSMADAAAVLSVNGGAGSGNQGGEIGPAVLPALQPLPSMTTATMPTMTGTSNAVNGTNGAVGTTPVAITPQWLNQRLPSIVNPAPAVIQQDCQSGFAGWVSENPVIAVAGLAALAFMVWGKK